MKRTFLFFFAACVFTALHAVSPSGTLPVLYIQTENNTPITSKEDYLNATYYLDALGLGGYENIGSKAAPLTMEIKGRGNYSWTGFDKKPYRIKLADKQPLLGMTKSKHFALLAHADDSRDRKGFMRNAVGFELSKMIGMAYTPDAKPLEVVLNGDYIGLYFLTETIRVDKDRVNITEQDDLATTDVEGGWLVEIDNYNTDPHVTITEGGNVYEMWITYKSPEELSYQQEEYLTQQMLLIDRLIYGDKNSDKLWEYLDMDALAKFYIVQEITDNYESFHGSCYLHKDMGSNAKWHFGPVWDFGSSFNRDKSQYIYQGDVWHNHWIPEICKFPAFMERVKEIWNEFYNGNYNNIYNFIDTHESLIAKAAAKDKERWSQYHGSQTISTYIDRTTEVLRKNAAWLNEQWKSNGNGGNNGGNNGNGNNGNNGNTDYPENPEFNPDGVTAMYIWQNGKQVAYDIAKVDSITFEEKEVEGIVVKAKVPASWTETIYVWVWGDEIPEGKNEQIAMRQGEWFVYVHEGSSVNIIFKQGKGWTGHPNQSEDIENLTKSACYILTQEGNNKAQVSAVDCE
ncbi:MAG: CotH kinase family protein [Paludibacteraceae bacterium]|nr:CotH kinase family protein [Paludibacteraceae bacterium]